MEKPKNEDRGPVVHFTLRLEFASILGVGLTLISGLVAILVALALTKDGSCLWASLPFFFMLLMAYEEEKGALKVGLIHFGLNALVFTGVVILQSGAPLWIMWLPFSIAFLKAYSESTSQS